MTAPIADAERGIRHVFLHGLMLDLHIGVPEAERGRDQRVRVDVDLGVREDGQVLADELATVVDYDAVAQRVRATARSERVRLVETLAERIAGACFDDRRVVSVRIRVAKLDVYPDIGAAGVEIERRRPTDRPPAPDFR